MSKTRRPIDFKVRFTPEERNLIDAAIMEYRRHHRIPDNESVTVSNFIRTCISLYSPTQQTEIEHNANLYKILSQRDSTIADLRDHISALESALKERDNAVAARDLLLQPFRESEVLVKNNAQLFADNQDLYAEVKKMRALAYEFEQKAILAVHTLATVVNETNGKSKGMSKITLDTVIEGLRETAKKMANGTLKDGEGTIKTDN